MSGAHVVADLIAALAFIAGYALRWAHEQSRRSRRRGGYVRRLPMASVHPREPKP